MGCLLTRKRSSYMILAKCNMMEIKVAEEWVLIWIQMTFFKCFLEEVWEEWEAWEAWVEATLVGSLLGEEMEEVDSLFHLNSDDIN